MLIRCYQQFGRGKKKTCMMARLELMFAHQLFGRGKTYPDIHRKYSKAAREDKVSDSTKGIYSNSTAATGK